MASTPDLQTRGRLFAAVFATTLAAGLAFTFARPPEYQSEATIAIYRTSPTAAGAETPADAVPLTSGDVHEAEAEPAAVLMEARRLLAWPMLLAVQDHLRETGATPSPPTAAELQQMLSAETRPETNVIQLTATGLGRELLPAMLQAWIDLYVAEKDARKASEGSSNREELAQQVAEIEQRLAGQRARLEAFRTANDIVSLEREDNETAARLKGLNASLAKATEKRAETEARVAAMRNDISIGKAGRSRWLGRRPHTRGVVMNPIDHPMGGGEGRSSGGRHPCTPWGIPTKGHKTRKNKRTDKYIIKRRGK